MARANTFVLLALLCTSASAVECQGGSCTVEQDETSLVQKNLKVQSGSERIPGLAGASDAAIVAATPVGIEYPAVTDSFQHGKLNIKDRIEATAADRIEFTNSQRLERKADHEQADAAVTADKQSVQDEIAADNAAVAETERIRKERLDHAAQLVKNAKDNAEALEIKAKQAEAAAALGRKVGQIQGSDAANEAWKDYKSDIASEKKQSALAKARAAAQAKEDAIRQAAGAKTAALAKADQDRVKKADADARAAVAKAAADSAVKRTSIGGAEGLKNRMTEEKADWAVTHYQRMADAAQARIDAAAAGEYPDGDWPIGPGDAPDAGADIMGEEAAVDAAAWGTFPN
jgi:hypothetical protein